MANVPPVGPPIAPASSGSPFRKTPHPFAGPVRRGAPGTWRGPVAAAPVVGAGLPVRAGTPAAGGGGIDGAASSGAMPAAAVPVDAARVAALAPRSRGELRMELAAEALVELDPDSDISCAFQEYLGEVAVPKLLAGMHASEAVGGESMRDWMLARAEEWLRKESRLAHLHWEQCAF